MKRLCEYIELIKNNDYIKRIFTDYGDQLKKITILFVFIVVVLFLFLIKDSHDGSADKINNENNKSTEQILSTIFVDIGGAVNSPVLVELPEGSRVEDAIVAAGGLTDDADLRSVNRAEFLIDGEKIYIPASIEIESGNIMNESSLSVTDNGISLGKININIADSQALQTLNGVGPATAQKIIDYRTENGRFKTTEEIKNVSGIGDKTYEKLKDFITT